MKVYKDKINILVSKNSWFEIYAVKLKKKLQKDFRVRIIYNQQDIRKSLINFILNLNEKITKKNLNKNKFNIVVHESNLPEGRGFSPMSWQILNGKKIIPIVLFQADENIDTGKIFLRDKIKLSGNELSDEWRRMQGDKTIELCTTFVKKMNKIRAIKQSNKKASHYPRRTKKDSSLDINKSIKEQFNLLRIVDNSKYPAFFEYKKNKYRLKIEKI